METRCPQCGSPFSPGDEFCRECGQRRPAVSVSEPGSESAEVLAVLPQAQLCKGFLGLGSSMSILVITREALLVIKSPEDLEEQISRMEDRLQRLRGEGVDDHELIRSQDFSQAPWQIYATRPLRDSLRPDGRLLEMSSILKAEVAMYEGWNDDTLHVFIPGETLKFIFWWPLGELAFDALRIALGDRVKNVS